MIEDKIANREIIKLRVNGGEYKFILGQDIDPAATLSYILREKLGLTGVKVSCEQGACGACTVLLNGRAVFSCMVLAVEADGYDIITIEGLPENDMVVECFANECEPGYGTAMQCGFCTPGFIMETHGLLNHNSQPTKAEIIEGLSGHICRCGCYKGIGHAVERAVEKLNANNPEPLNDKNIKDQEVE
jgi:aerobic-type carbon monoxide dehydrogenase small subunit (CoxS/CutS family)